MFGDFFLFFSMLWRIFKIVIIGLVIYFAYSFIVTKSNTDDNFKKGFSAVKDGLGGAVNGTKSLALGFLKP